MTKKVRMQKRKPLKPTENVPPETLITGILIQSPTTDYYTTRRLVVQRRYQEYLARKARENEAREKKARDIEARVKRLERCAELKKQFRTVQQSIVQQPMTFDQSPEGRSGFEEAWGSDGECVFTLSSDEE